MWEKKINKLKRRKSVKRVCVVVVMSLASKMTSNQCAASKSIERNFVKKYCIIPTMNENDDGKIFN